MDFKFIFNYFYMLFHQIDEKDGERSFSIDFRSKNPRNGSITIFQDEDCETIRFDISDKADVITEKMNLIEGFILGMHSIEHVKETIGDSIFY
jgi:hypothetical protein